MNGPKLWPAELAAGVRSDRYRRAEVRVYDRLKATLPAGWTVFYSRPWLGITPSGAERDGEADFVIVHPQRGFLVLEVKGGGISYDPAREAWQSRDAHGIRHNIKNPFGQARRAKHELLEKVQQHRSWPRDRFIRARHGVVFPDAASPPGNLGADMPRELICCRPDLEHIGEWVEERLSGGNEDELGTDGVAAFERLLAQPFTLRVPLGHVLEDDERAIELLTPEQFHVLEAIAYNCRVAVGGGAGTGKTVLAAEDAARHALSGSRALLACLSPALAEDLRNRLSGSGVTVLCVQELYREVLRHAGLPERPFEWNSAPEHLLDALGRDQEFRFDVVVVDEAQDFPSHWWVALDGLLGAGQPKLHAFYDCNQSVYGNVAQELAGFSMLPVHLGRNLRNTKAIHAAASRFYEGLPVRADGPDGVSVEWLTCQESDVIPTVNRVVLRLIGKEAVPPEKIAVLCPGDDTLRRLREESDVRAKPVILDTIAGFKGLERGTVVLAATRELADRREMAYVGLSRARAHLVVVGSSEILRWLHGA